MGGDGGTLLNKRQVLNRQRYYEQQQQPPAGASGHGDKEKQGLTCAISLEQLKAPIVVDLRGVLYNKVAVVDALLRRAEAAVAGAPVNGDLHIRKLKDVREVVSGISEEGVFKCAVTGVGSTNAQRFVLHWDCGNIMLESEVSKQLPCVLCGRTSETWVKLGLDAHDAVEQEAKLKDVVRKRPRDEKTPTPLPPV